MTSKKSGQQCLYYILGLSDIYAIL